MGNFASWHLLYRRLVKWTMKAFEMCHFSCKGTPHTHFIHFVKGKSFKTDTLKRLYQAAIRTISLKAAVHPEQMPMGP
jgi:hypothetical protein